MNHFHKGNTRAARLSAAQVQHILTLYNDEGWTQAKLCREFQVSINTIGRIVRGETWQNVALPPRVITGEEIEASLARVLADINQTAEKLPIAKEIRTDKMLDELSDKAKVYGAR